MAILLLPCAYNASFSRVLYGTAMKPVGRVMYMFYLILLRLLVFISVLQMQDYS